MRFLLLAFVVAVAASGCCHTKPVVVTKKADLCLVERPPLRPPTVVTYGPESGCPSRFEVCYDDVGAEAIAAYTEQLIGWAAETWYRCGSRPKANSQPTGPTRPPAGPTPEPAPAEPGVEISAPPAQ